MKIKPIQLRKSYEKNKRGQIESAILAIVTIVVIGIIIFFFNRMNKQFYGTINDYLEENPTYNNSEAQQSAERFEEIEGGRIWDYAFLAIFIGLNIQMIVFSFASRQNLVFFWLFVIIGLVVLTLAVILSNTWQSLIVNPEFVETLTRFPITNALLGSYFPVIITGLFYLTLIVLFGKFPGQQE